MTPAVRSVGRPRDEAIDEAVRKATVELLTEMGYAATTMRAVARRSGVAPPALYRRWRNRVELIESVVFPSLTVDVAAGSGDLRSDLQRFVDAFTAALSKPFARAAIPGLLSEYQHRPDAHRDVALRLGTGMRDSFRTMLALQPATTVDRSIDPDVVLDLLVGSVFYRLFLLPFTGRVPPTDATAELLVRSLRPRARRR
jgi:AcrR family transcriptional regulator